MTSSLTSFRPVLLAALLALFGALFQPLTTFACPPPPDGYVPVPIVDRARQADVVIVGIVVSTATTTSNIATVSVSETLKGAVGAQVTIEGFGDGQDCSSAVRVGEKWVFFAEHHGGQLRAQHIKRFDAIAPVDATTIAAARAGASGAEPVFLPRLDYDR